ncbi:MAG: STAS domain-containing protein [Pseudobutyrivibrio sp.]|uniref:STAS domain-containing protein n=1 Tax=Pseudobutyrivibrio sp. TaxID=2014367 RepID=UPI0025FD32A8|nr:STAS domain-containing protein [Pseudobutyrivibrio sp.]MBQ8490364.1 STAS domain-containing protein [Pseudobutyrivibrio sp.]
MEISEKLVDEAIWITISGNVDSISSSELQQHILTAFQQKKNVVIDFANVRYMSSAGLRAILLGQKTAVSKGGSLKLIHVQEAVMSVFRITGFDKLLTIES